MNYSELFEDFFNAECKINKIESVAYFPDTPTTTYVKLTKEQKNHIRQTVNYIQLCAWNYYGCVLGFRKIFALLCLFKIQGFNMPVSFTLNKMISKTDSSLEDNFIHSNALTFLKTSKSGIFDIYTDDALTKAEKDYISSMVFTLGNKLNFELTIITYIAMLIYNDRTEIGELTKEIAEQNKDKLLRAFRENSSYDMNWFCIIDAINVYNETPLKFKEE